MFFLFAIGVALFTFFTASSGSTSDSSNYRQIVDMNYDINIRNLKEKLIQKIKQNIGNMNSNIILNQNIYDSSFLSLKLSMAEFLNFQYELENLSPKFEPKYNQASLNFIISSFDMILHLEAHLPFSKSINFMAKIQAKNLEIEISYILKRNQMILNNNFIKKFKIHSFEYDVESNNAFYQFLGDQVNDYLKKNHKFLESELLRILEKEMKSVNSQFEVVPNDSRIQQIEIIDENILRVKVRYYEDEVLSIS